MDYTSSARRQALASSSSSKEYSPSVSSSCANPQASLNPAMKLDAQVYQLQQLFPVLQIQLLPQFPAELLDLLPLVCTLGFPEEPLVQRLQ